MDIAKPVIGAWWERRIEEVMLGSGLPDSSFARALGVRGEGPWLHLDDEGRVEILLTLLCNWIEERDLRLEGQEAGREIQRKLVSVFGWLHAADIIGRLNLSHEGEYEGDPGVLNCLELQLCALSVPLHESSFPEGVSAIIGEEGARVAWLASVECGADAPEDEVPTVVSTLVCCRSLGFVPLAKYLLAENAPHCVEYARGLLSDLRYRERVCKSVGDLREGKLHRELKASLVGLRDALAHSTLG